MFVSACIEFQKSIKLKWKSKSYKMFRNLKGWNGGNLLRNDK